MNTKTWTVWVGGGEVTDNTVTLEEARNIAEHWLEKGYQDTYIDNVTWQDINDQEHCKNCAKELTEVGEMDEYQLCHHCYCKVMDTTNKGEQQ